MHGGGIAEEDTPAEDRRSDASGELVGREGHGLLGHAELTRGVDLLVYRRVLSRSRGDTKHAALAQPRVDALALTDGADAGNDLLTSPRHCARVVVAEALAQRGQVAPVAVDEPAVAAGRPVAADPFLEHDHIERRILLGQRERGPEAGEPAADDRHVGVGVPWKRGRRLDRPRLFEPPDLTDV